MTPTGDMMFNYFDRWFLVAPEGVAKLEEIPEPWGWYAPENGRLRRLKEAAKNPKVNEVDRHFLGALLRRTAKTDDAFVQARVEAALTARRQTMNADAERRVLEKMGTLKEEAEQWAKLRDLLKTKPNDYVYAPEVVEAVRVVLSAGVTGTYSGIRHLVAECDRFREKANALADELGIPKQEEIFKQRKRR